jgi:hypothetical protein
MSSKSENSKESLLTQIVRSIVDGNIPPMTEVLKFHTFLNNLGVFEARHPVHAIEALEDWVLVIGGGGHLHTYRAAAYIFREKYGYV